MFWRLLQIMGFIALAGFLHSLAPNETSPLAASLLALGIVAFASVPVLWLARRWERRHLLRTGQLPPHFFRPQHGFDQRNASWIDRYPVRK